uniref:flagellar hook-basal body complex protein n=1 Tax=Eubacterium cellulosolvens TaxID=29322 RepID=UPI000488231D|nr:flagellar hook-basal body complex protein [[Eubacterium] cellulosolvens]
MLRAMDSAVSGLRSHQNKLDVLGNNIANVNTNGFKSQNYTFKDAMYQTSAASSGGARNDTGTATIGGTNPSQFGYGSVQGAIATDFTSSTPQYVGGFNASINGSGFFITKAANSTVDLSGDHNTQANVEADSVILKNANFNYTRVGQFTIDANGYMVDANKNFVYGYQPTIPGENGVTANNISDPTSYNEKKLVALRAPWKVSADGNNFEFEGGKALQLKSVQVDNDGIIKATINNDNGDAMNIVLGKVAIAAFQNQEGLAKAGNNTFNTRVGDNTGLLTATVPGGATPSLMGGYLEGSNVDLAKEFSDMITTERGFQANAKLITVSDEVLQELVNMKR